jgi:hypothetical protein
MSSRLLASRASILDALAAAGISSATTGKWSAPVVLVEAGDPWAAIEVSGMGRRRAGRWRLTAVAGRADTAGALERLAELVDAVDAAFLTLPGVELPTWARPFDMSLDGAQYAASSATVQLITPKLEEVLP